MSAFKIGEGGRCLAECDAIKYGYIAFLKNNRPVGQFVT
jgi:hypothetical protein